MKARYSHNKLFSIWFFFLWEKRVDELTKRESKLEENLRTLFSLVWGQCTDPMRARIRSLQEYEAMEEESDSLALIKCIRNVMYSYQSVTYRCESIHDALKRFWHLHQGKLHSCQQYLEELENCVAVVDHCGGLIGVFPGIIDYLYELRGINNPTAIQIAEATKDSQEMFLATYFFLNADKARYGKLIEDTQNAYLQGTDNYPKTVTAAYSMLTNYRRDPRNATITTSTTSDGITFAHSAGGDAEVTLANDGKGGRQRRDRATVTCSKCKALGHYANEEICPMYNKPKGSTESGTQLLTSGVDANDFDDDDTVSFEFLQSGVVCKTDEAPHVPINWILLDNQSTMIDVFCNQALLRNIRASEKQMDIHCNAGVASTNLIGDLPGYGTVWYHPQGIANILSLTKVASRDGYRVTFDSNGGNQFLVHKPDGSVRTFKQSPRGLYFMDTNATEQSVTLLQTVADKKSNYTNALYSRAVLARSIQKIIGRPSTRTFMRIVDNNLLPNCPINRDDILAAEDIFGPDVGSLKGKTVRRSSTPVNTSMITIPASLMERYRDITLSGDIMYINKIPFFVTYSRHIRFGTIEVLTDRKSKTIMAAMKVVKSIYSKRGFKIVHLLMDNEFEPQRGDLAMMHITLNTVAEAEHVPDIERYIRTIKERTRAVYNTLPFARMPARIIIEMVSASVFWLNTFPPEDGVSATLSPRSIVVGLQVDYAKHCQLEFGTYAQVHESHDNSMIPRTAGALALRPTGNIQGGHYFYSLTTGRRISRNHWTALPMPADVINRVHVLARRDKASAGVAFTDCAGKLLLNDDDSDASDDDDSSYNPDNDSNGSDNSSNDDDTASDDDDDDHDNNAPANYNYIDIAGVNEPANPNIAGVDHNNNLAGVDHDNNDANGGNDPENEADADNDNAEANNDADQEAEIEEAEEVVAADNNGADVTQQFEQEMETKYGERTGPYELRPRRPRDYNHLHATLSSTVMTQHSMKKGIKIFGEAGIEAVQQELKQLHDRKVLEPRSATELSASEKKAALQYLMFLKQKRSGKIKGGCADGRKQREHTNKEDASSPTVAIESVLLSCTIDAKENRDVATVDIPGAFMQADMDEVVHLKMQGQMAELLVKLDPKLYQKHVQTENGKTVLYVELRKALYGTLRAALLFWRLLTDKLKE